jgi:amidase
MDAAEPAFAGAARQADARAKAGERRPLVGAPIAVKDDCDVAGDTTAFGGGAA